MEAPSTPSQMSQAIMDSEITTSSFASSPILPIPATDSVISESVKDIEKKTRSSSPTLLSKSSSLTTLDQIPRAIVKRKKPINWPPPSGKWPRGRRVKATEFTKFGALPVELRRKVWKYAIPEDRVVTIKSYDKPSTVLVHWNCSYRGLPPGLDALPEFCGYEAMAFGDTDVPALLRTCSESRISALKEYELVFSEVLNGQPIYFNFGKDSLHFLDHDAFYPKASHTGAVYGDLRCHCSTGKFDSAVNLLQNKLRHLIISQHDEYHQGQRLIKNYKALETLTIASIVHAHGRSLGTKSEKKENEIHKSLWVARFVEDRGEEKLPEIKILSMKAMMKVTGHDLVRKHAPWDPIRSVYPFM